MAVELWTHQNMKRVFLSELFLWVMYSHKGLIRLYFKYNSISLYLNVL